MKSLYAFYDYKKKQRTERKQEEKNGNRIIETRLGEYRGRTIVVRPTECQD